MVDSRFVDVVEPAEAFGALADGTRVAILRALWETDGHAATFSTLREAVGNPDSGRFSYHLGELVGLFVTRTDDGYELTQAGKQVNGAIDGGAYTMEGSIEPLALEGSCRVCAGALELRYGDELVRVECEECPATSEFAVPPGVFAGHDRGSIPRVASRYLRTTIRHVASGFCWFCDGRVRPTVAPAPAVLDQDELPPDAVPAAFDGRVEDVPWVRFDCRRCDATSKIGLDQVLLDHPAVAGFYHDHGVDVRERFVWEFPRLGEDPPAVAGRNPFRAEVTYGADGDELALVVDGDLDVVDVAGR